MLSIRRVLSAQCCEQLCVPGYLCVQVSVTVFGANGANYTVSQATDQNGKVKLVLQTPVVDCRNTNQVSRKASSELDALHVGHLLTAPADLSSP